MSNWFNPITVTAALGIITIFFAWFKPYGTRIFFGIFFLLMGLGVNLACLLTDPTLYVAVGQNGLLPVYSWFFTTILPWNPPLFVIALILFEVCVGVLILSKGKAARLGLIGATLFCLFVTPIGIEEITAPLLAVALLLLLRRTYDRSLLGMFIRRPAPAAR